MTEEIPGRNMFGDKAIRSLIRLLERQTGFTFMEIMVSLSIIAGLLITVITTLTYHLSLTDRQVVITEATLLARQKLNDALSEPVSSEGAFTVPYENYRYSVLVRESRFPDMTEVSVTVKNGEQEVSLAELVRKRR